jgi:glutamate synthase (NADPH/NADH) small chain
MADKMQQFLRVAQQRPPKREAGERHQDFGEIYEVFATDPAGVQASRCEQCGIPFCHVGCPLHNNIPDWLKLTAEGRIEEAYRLSQSTNSFPEICGRICPQERLCEGNCVLEQSKHGTVTIGAIEKFLTETAFENGWVPAISPRQERDGSVAIIGAGPAGLAAAGELRRKGYRVHVYDRHDRVGGLLVYGIPNFKLDKSVVLRRQRQLADGGVVFHRSFEVGRNASLAELRNRHDAVFIATGLYKARALPLPGSGLSGIVQALDYLIASNRKGFGEHVPAFEDGSLNARGKHVVVLGGGDTAMDCCNTAVRQGALKVTAIELQAEAEMRGSTSERAHARDGGVNFNFRTTAEAFLGDGNVTGVRAVRARFGAPGPDGRRPVETVPGTNFTVEADLVIQALGFGPEDVRTRFGEPDMEVTPMGTIKVDPGQATSLPGVFAGGDIVRGASLVEIGRAHV